VIWAATSGYSPDLWVCYNMPKYMQTQAVTKYAYYGKAVSCAANFTIN